VGSYRRKAPGSTGIITLLASRPATGSPEQEFAALWRMTVPPIRIYDEYVLGRWTRAMALLDEAATPPAEVQYMRIEDAK
jgi:hypothetical protein